MTKFMIENWIWESSVFFSPVCKKRMRINGLDPNNVAHHLRNFKAAGIRVYIDMLTVLIQIWRFKNYRSCAINKYRLPTTNAKQTGVSCCWVLVQSVRTNTPGATIFYLSALCIKTWTDQGFIFYEWSRTAYSSLTVRQILFHRMH